MGLPTLDPPLGTSYFLTELKILRIPWTGLKSNSEDAKHFRVKILRTIEIYSCAKNTKDMLINTAEYFELFSSNNRRKFCRLNCSL